MQQYLDLLKDILENGEEKEDRTNTGTLSVFGRQLRFDLNKGFPAVTTKKLAWKACVGELLWFIEGSSDERRLAEITHGTRENVTTIWTPNAQASYWKDRVKFEGDLGRVYGVQWRDWNGVDQLTNLIEGIKTDPNGRRHILSAWNVSDLDIMALPPCHVMSQFYVSKNRELSCHMYQRSQDVFLGAPFNYASYALLTHMIAQVCDYTVGELIISTGDTHIYKNHIEQVKTQLTRLPLALPTLWLNPEVKEIYKFTMKDIMLHNYECHSTIKAEMAV
jgi:thymidylate synthase